MPCPGCAGADVSSPRAYTGIVRRRWAPPEGRRRCRYGGKVEVAPTRAARLLAFAGDVVAVVVILDTLVRLGRDDQMPARSADAAADRLRADPALSRHLPGPRPLPGYVTRSPPAGSRP